MFVSHNEASSLKYKIRFISKCHQICLHFIFPSVRYFLDFCLQNNETQNTLKGETTKLWIFIFFLLLEQLWQHNIMHYGFLVLACQLPALHFKSAAFILVLQSCETGENAWVFWTAGEDKYSNLFLNKLWVFNSVTPFWSMQRDALKL